jgi:release factor glutamine methyltransferase
VRVREALEVGRQALIGERIPSPSLTAAVLLAHCLRRSREFLLTYPEHALDAPSADCFLEAIRRRARREPLQYITGLQEFYGRPFSVDSSVLIPRPETECVVEKVLRLNRWSRPRILDVGTGSGCIAATLALEIPDARVFASDISPAALETAGRNARALGADIRLAACDLVDAWSGPFDCVVANPPYIGTGEKEGLEEEVVGHEPALALFAAPDPIGLYRRLIREAADRLSPGGCLVLEIGDSMLEAVRVLFDRRWTRITFDRDLQGIARVLSAERPPISEGRSGTDP